MQRAFIVAVLASLAMTATATPMTTANYFPLVDGARYDYVFINGPHTTATAVVHTGQNWAGIGGLTSMHMTLVCQQGVSCNQDSVDFYRMDLDGMHYFGGNAATPDNTTHYMMRLTSPEWLLRNPVSPGMMMGPGMGYQNTDMWQASVAGMNSMMGAQGYMSSYQALALETVVTPAGTFTNALHVHEQRGSGYQRDVWYAAGIGMVRWMDGQEEAVLARMTIPAGPVPKVAMAIEYYHAGLDHYFVTADPSEINALDDGRMTGWQRTGMGFNVVAADDATAAAATPVCRYYGLPGAGLDTHFYSASPDECAAVAQNWPMQWVLESSNVFRVYMPDPAAGACPPGTQPVYRTWNTRMDSNHRYTMDGMVQDTMMNRGNVPEGYGNPAVAMCSPQ